MKKSVTVGVWDGGGPEPGYEWTVLILRYAFDDAASFLSDSQYEHIAYQVKDLATHRDPSHSVTLSLDKVETFYELREKSGATEGLNVRVYYDIVDIARCIRLLAVDAKKNDGPISVPVKARVLRRQKRWNDGMYPMLAPGRGKRELRERTGGDAP